MLKHKDFLKRAIDDGDFDAIHQINADCSCDIENSLADIATADNRKNLADSEPERLLAKAESLRARANLLEKLAAYHSFVY